MKNLILLLFSFTILLSIGCNDDNFTQFKNLKINDFPLKIGSHWQYLRVNDFNTDLRDTINCIVKADSIIDEKSTLLLQYEDKQGVFLEEFIHIEADTMSFLNQHGHLIKRFIFPLEAGNTSPNIEIINNNSSFEGFSYSYQKTTEVKHHSGFGNYELDETFHLKKNIGIVVRSISETNLGQTKLETWILMSYNL